MKTSSRSHLLSKTSQFEKAEPTTRRIAFIVAAFMLAQMAGAQTLYWDPGASGTGVWDSLTPNWSANPGGGANTIWTNGDIADFSASPVTATSYSISLGGPEMAGGLTFGDGTATLTGGTFVLSGGGQVSVSASEGIIISPITGSAGLTKTGGGQLDLQGVNTFTGNLTNRAGSVTLDNDQAGGEGAIVLNPSAAVVLNSSLPSLTLTNNVEILGSSSTVEIDAGTNNTIVSSGVISGPHNWSANGPGILMLSNVNAFGGILTVAQGTLVATMDGSLAGVGNDVIVSNNATLAFQGGFTYTGTKTVVLNGAGAGGGPALNSIGGDNTFYGPVILATNSEIGASAGSLELVGAITGAYNLVTIGDVAFGSSGNTFVNTIVSQGDLYIEDASSAGIGLITVNAGAVLEGVSSVAAPGGVSLSGTISPGAGEPASFGTGFETWNGGASYVWTLGDATGSAGVGYSTLNINGSLTFNPNSQPFTIYIGSFNPDFDMSGPADDFDNTREYSWTIATASGGISGFNSTNFVVNSSGFENDLGGGSFRVLISGNRLLLEFDPAPVISCQEPIIADNDTNECSATVFFAATATNYSNLGTVTIAYQTNGIPIVPPWVFPKGITTVTSIATDAVGDTARCSFTVTVNDVQPPTLTTRATPQTIAADAETAKAALPDLTGEVIASDNCGGPITYSQVPAPGTIVNLGKTTVTVWAADQYGNSNSCSAIITVIYTNPPVFDSCAPEVTVSVTQDKEPYATGYPTVTDPDGPVTLTYSDDVSELTNHDVTGTIARTWTAEDASSNIATCVQTITVVDTNAPYFTYVPAAITTTNDPGQCGADVDFSSAALDLGYFQGFENANWVLNTNSANNDLDWNPYYSGGPSLSTMYRVPSGIGGIVSPNGVAYAIVDSSATAAIGYNSNGVFTAFGGGLMPFQSGYKVALDIYINLNDPEVMNSTPASGYGFDLDTDPGAFPVAGYGAQDFIFHVAAYSPTGIVVAADNNSFDRGDQRQTDLLQYADHGMITNSGWFKFEWTFRNTNGVLAVDMAVRSITNRATLFSETMSNPADLIANIAGNPNYLWFNFIDDNQLPIADATYQRIIPVESSIASGTQFPVGTTTVKDTATDDSGNSTNTAFTITVNDVEPPVLIENPIRVTLSNGSYILSTTDEGNLVTGSFDHCGISSTNVYPMNFDCSSLGTDTVTVTLTDTNNLITTGTATVVVQNLTPPAFTMGVSNETVVADAVSGEGLIPNVAALVAVSSCGTDSLIQSPVSGTPEPPGSYAVTVSATDQNGNISSSSGTITVIYTNSPVVTSCAPDVTVTTIQDKDPYATGYPTFSSPADEPVTVTYSDNYTNLTACDSTGFILRTWTAEDASSNIATCLQTITVTDTNAPDFTYVPANITTTNDPGQCGALINFGGAAVDLGYLQGFENPNWFASTNPPGSTLDWDEGNSAVYRVLSGNNGITAPNGVAYAVVDSTVPQAGANFSSSGAFTFLGGLSSWQFGDLYGYNGTSSAFGLGYRASLNVYINLNDPAVTSATPTSGYAWDLSTSASGTQSNFLSDFVFHAAAYDPSGVVIGASTSSSDNAANRGADLRTGTYATITSNGWYKFDWNFYGNNAGGLSVDMKVRDAHGTVLFAQTITNGTDVAEVDGHPNYMWFTFLTLNQLPIANTVFERNEPVTSSIASGTLFPVGTTTVTNTTEDACSNSTNTLFTITVNDVERPTLTLNPITVDLNNGSYTLAQSDLSSLLAGSSDPCEISGTNVSPGTFTCGNVGANTVTVTLTDVHGNSTTGTGTVIVQDLTPPTLVLNPISVTLDANGDYSLSPSDVAALTSGSSDPCGITNATVTPNSFSCGNVGSNPVTVVLTDSHGNSTTNATTITVLDTTPPTLVTHGISVTLGSDGTYALSPADEAAMTTGSGDNCGIQSTIFNPSSFTYCQVGSSVPVTVTMTDVHGNVSTGSATVTVSAPATQPETVYVDASYTNECNVTFPNANGSGSYYYGYNAFSTIQAGLNAVAPGGIVTVAPGTYNESPIINNPVTLTSIGGTNAAATIIELPEEPSPDYDWAALAINASSVSVEGFTIIGFDAPDNNMGPTAGYSSVDIFLDAQLSNPPAVTNIDIGNNIFEIGAPNLEFDSGPSAGYGISTEFPAFLGTSSNEFGQYAPGTSPSGPLDSLKVHNNVFEPVDVPPSYETNGAAFFINPAANFTFVSNTITGGLSISQTSATNSLIADNIVIGVSTNDNSGGFGTLGYPDPDFYGGNAVIMDNVITNVATAIAIYDSEDITVENNMLNDNGVGVSVQDSGYDPIYPAGNTVQITDNSLTNDVVGIINTSTNSIPVASSNWWGNVSGPAGAQNTYGTGSPVIGDVTVNSWLQSGANANTGVGFTPTAGENYPPTQLVFTTEPGGANLGGLLSPEPMITIEDANGDTTPWVTTNITIAISNNPAFGLLAGTANEMTVSGVATFTDLYVTNDGGSGYTLVASAPGLTSALSTPFDIQNPAPGATSLSPFFIPASANGITLTVNGSNFVANSTVDWNGQGLPTTYVSSTQLTATVPGSDVATAGTALVTVVSPTPGGGTSASLTFYVEATQPTVVYVDKKYIGLPANTWVDWPYSGAGTNIVGYDAFGTIQGGVNAVAANGTVNVAAGTYAENVTITESMTVSGAQAGTNADTRETAFVDGKANPAIEAIITAPTDNASIGNLITVESSNVIVSGFVLDGNNPALGGTNLVGGVIVNAEGGIANVDINDTSHDLDNLNVKYNILQNFYGYGVELWNDGAASTGNSVSANHISNFGNGGWGIILAENAYSDITSNTIVDTANNGEIGVLVYSFYDNGAMAVSHNQFTVGQDGDGVALNLFYPESATVNITGNTINAATGVTGADDETWGMYILSVQSGLVNIANNTVGSSGGQFARGINLWNLTAAVPICGGSISSSLTGIDLDNIDPYFGSAENTFVGITNVSVSGCDVGVMVRDIIPNTSVYENGPYAVSGNVSANLSEMSVSGNVTGISVLGGAGTNLATVLVKNGSVTGNTNGISADAGKALIENDDLTGNSNAGISATNNALVDAGDCSDSDLTGLGSSGGGNSLTGYGFDGTAPWAIQSSNTRGGTVLAENDIFGATVGQNIALDISDPNGTVEYSQGPAVIVTPANVTVVCASEVPAGATDLTQFTGQGGYFSGNNSTVTFTDSDSTNFVNGTNIITILRAYIIGNSCGNLTATQTITLNEAPPVVTVPANIVQSNDPGVCGATVNFPAPAFADNCGIASYSVMPVSGTSFPIGTTPVIVVATDNNGLSTTNTFTVTVNDTELPVITNTMNIVQAVDVGQTYATVNFTVGATHPCGIGSVSASWTGNSQSAAGGTLAVNGWKFPIGTNTVTVTATDVHNVTSTSTFTVAVIGLPQIVLQPQSRTNNAGTTAPFVVTASSPATLTYQWFKDGIPLGNVGNILGATQQELYISDVSNSDEGTYYVQVSNLAGTVTSSNATLTVIDPPLSATITPSSQTNDASATAQFVVSAAGTPPFSYQWTKVTATSTNRLSDIGNIFGSTSNVLTISNLLGADQAEYVVTVSNPAGSDTTNALLFVNDPAILGQPSDVTNRLGGSATFSVTAAGTAPLGYQWQQDGIDLPGATSRTLTLNNIGDSSVGDYTVVVSNSVGEATSDIATLTVTHPPVITSQPANLTVDLGQNATFSVAVNGDTPFTYQWFQNGLPVSGGNVSGATTRQLIITNAMTSNAGTYFVAITNDVGQTISSNATLTVIVPPAITSQPVGLTNNAGSIATFAVGASGTAPAYQWYQITATATNKLTDNANITGSTSNVLTIADVLGADDAYYMALASNQAGTAASSNALLVVNDPIITNEPSSVTANLGSPASFTVGAFGTSPQYQWYQNGNAISGANASTYSIANVVNTNSGSYTVVVTNIFGVVTSTPAVSLTVIDPPVIIGQPQSLTVGAGATAVFAVTNTGTSPVYQWYFGNEPLNNGPSVTGANGPILTLTQVADGNAGTYSVVLSNSAATVTSSNAVLTVIDPPVIAGLEPSSQTNNATATVQFTVNASGTAPFTYQWTKITATLTNILDDGGSISGSTSNVLTITNILAVDQAEYLVKVSNSAGTVSTNGTLVVIDPAIFAQPVGQTNFLGSAVTFSVTAAGTSPLNYQWRQNGSPLFGANSNVLTLRNIADSDAGSYTVVIANSAGSVTSAPAVLVTLSPLITQQPANAVVLAGQSASFSVSVNGELPFSYQWLFDGTNIAGATNRIYTIASAQPGNVGGYQVIVQNPVGTQVSQTATLSVGPSAFLTALPYNNGVFTLFVNGAPGHLYTIQGSTNFVNWFPIVTNTTPFIFTNNSGLPYEFYRALFQQ